MNPEDHWRYVERVTVRHVGDSFIGEARTHADFAVGEILDTPAAALESAAKAMAALYKPKVDAQRAKQAATQPARQADDWEDLL